MEIVNLSGGFVNNFFVKEKGKNILIDTGYPGHFSKFEKALNKNNTNLNDIDFLLLRF